MSVKFDPILGKLREQDVGSGAVPSGGTTNQVLAKNSNADYDLKWNTSSGTGDVVGPVSATDNAITRFDTTTGKLVQNSLASVDDTGIVSNIANKITGTAGAGYLTLVGQSSNPASPLAGTLLIHSKTVNGFTRLEQDNEATTNVVYGRDNVFIVKNETGATITKGSVVYESGTVSNVPQITKARANSLGTLPAIGIVVDDIAHLAFGQVMSLGILYFDTSVFSDGDTVWVSTATAGLLQRTRPSGTSGAYVQRMGTIMVSSANPAIGQMYVATAPAILNMETGTNAATWTGNAVVATTFNSGTLSGNNSGDNATNSQYSGLINSVVPTGAILPYGGSLSPTGFLLCDGTSYLRADYNSLFTVISTSYGSVDGTHFNVPDIQDKYPKGKSGSTSLGGTGGSSTHTHASHTYSPTGTVSQPTLSMNSYTPAGTASSVGAGTPTGTLDSIGAGTPTGTVSQPTFTGTSVAPTGVVSQPTFTGTSVAPTGTVSQPTFTGTSQAGHTHTFTGTALAGHTHTFTGSAANTGTASAGASAVGATASTVTLRAHTHSVTATGTNSSVSGGTPTGTVDSGGTVTPTGTVSQPTFTGTSAAPTGIVSQPTFTGTSAAPTGTVSQPTFTGTALGGHTHTFAGTALSGHTHTFTGTAATLTGTVSQPTFTGTSANLTHDTPSNEPPYVIVNYIIKY